MNIKIETKINIPATLAKVEDPVFWKYAGNEWWKLITPYTPMKEGVLFETVDIKGDKLTGSIEYNVPYSHYLYNGELMVDPDTGSSYAKQGAKKVYADKALQISKARHPLASKEWDKAAEPTQKPKLIRAMQAYVDSGRLKLNG